MKTGSDDDVPDRLSGLNSKRKYFEIQMVNYEWLHLSVWLKDEEDERVEEGIDDL